MRKGFLAAVIAASLFGGAAKAETYICSLKAEGRDTGWISKTIGITIDDSTGQALVSDSVILGAYKKPIAAQVVVNSPKRVSVRWEVSGEKDIRNRVYNRFMFKLTVFKSRGNKATVRAYPAGAYKQLGAAGKCELRRK